MKYLVIISFLFFGTSTTVDAQCCADTQQIAQVKEMIKIQYDSWVIFSNGTFVVITYDTTTINLRTRAIEFLKKAGSALGKRVSAGSYVLNLENANGWVVDSPFEGLYTYVGRNELKEKGMHNPADQDIVSFAMAKRRKDVAEHKVVESSY